MSSLREFKKAGHPLTLLSAFLYFDVSFMVWVILGPVGPFIGEAFHLSASQKGLLTAVPLLGGSFFRPVLGWMTERIGGRRTALIGLGVTLLPLLIAWRFADSFAIFIVLGFLLGVAGASFAAALPLASSWYPPEHQGLAMGIAGAGNSGTLLCTLFAPRLAMAYGWHNVFAIAMVPIVLVWIIFFALAKEAPGIRKVKTWADYAGILKITDTAWFCFLYSLSFGGFVGLASYLSIFFNDQYHLSKVQSGDLTTFVVLFGSFLRPVGGVLSDRIGGYRMLLIVLPVACLAMFGVALLPSTYIALGLLALAMAMLGMGNGSIFQLLPQRFPDRVGIMTGIVGAAGGLGGFFLPSILGTLKQHFGSFGLGFAVVGSFFLLGALGLLFVRSNWLATWPYEAARRGGLITPTAKEPHVYAANA